MVEVERAVRKNKAYLLVNKVIKTLNMICFIFDVVVRVIVIVDVVVVVVLSQKNKKGRHFFGNQVLKQFA